MQITKDFKNGINIISVQGEVDLSNSPKLRDTFKKLDSVNILVDLSEVAYMDSSGVATLVEAMQKANKNSGKFKLCGLKGEVKNIFEIARLDEVFSIYEDVKSALDSF